MKRILIGGIILGAIAVFCYLATVGCCQLVGFRSRQRNLSERLQLTPAQRNEMASLEKNFLVQKGASCQTLCAKRAQLIQLLKQPQPDVTALHLLAEEIGQEQVALEKATVDYLVTLGGHLEPAQREKLTALVSEELRTACRQTACGTTPGCFLTKERAKQ